MKDVKVVIRSITKLSNKIRRNFASLASRSIFSGAEGRTLHFLIASRDIEVFQKDIEEEFSIRSSTATVLLQKMEADGLIKRVPTESDGRRKKITLTDKALKYKEQVIAQLDKMDSRLIEGIREDELSTFLSVIKRMGENLD